MPGKAAVSIVCSGFASGIYDITAGFGGIYIAVWIKRLAG